MHGHWIRKLTIPASVALIAALSVPSAARADLIITAQETGDPSTGPINVAVGNPFTPGGVIYNPPTAIQFNDFLIQGITVSETQTPVLSEVLSSALSFTNTDTVAHTITITIQASNFTSPTTPPTVTLLESLGGTTPVTGFGAPNAIAFTSQASATPPAATLTPDITGRGVAYASSSNQQITTGLTGSYSVFQTYVITLNPGANLQFTGRTDLLPGVATPEPATVAMALTALPLLGLALLRRRRARA